MQPVCTPPPPTASLRVRSIESTNEITSLVNRLSQDSAHSNIHLVKLTRLLRLARLLQKMDRYSQYSAVILTMLMLFFIVVAHWLACIWYVIAEKERLRNDKDWDLGESSAVFTYPLFAICYELRRTNSYRGSVLLSILRIKVLGFPCARGMRASARVRAGETI